MEHQELNERLLHISYITEVTFPIFFAVAGAFIGNLCSKPDLSETLGIVLLLILVLIICLGTTGSIHLLYSTIRHRSTFQQPLRNLKSWKIRIFFMLLFVCGIIAGKILLVITNIECWRVTQSKKEIGEIVFRVVDVGFLTSQVAIVLACVIRGRNINGRKYVRIDVMMIIFTNATFWLVVTTYDVSGFYYGSPYNDTNQSSQIFEPASICVFNSSSYSIFKRILPYTEPMHLEFFILASSSFMLLLSRAECHTRNHALDIEMLSTQSEQVIAQSQGEKISKCWLTAGIGNIFLNSLALIGKFLIHGEYITFDKISKVQNGTYALLGTISVVACIYIFMGFHVLSKMFKLLPSNQRVVSKRDTILVLCMAGTIMYNVMDIFVVFSTANSRSFYEVQILTFANIVLILEAFYQTLFIHKTKAAIRVSSCMDMKGSQIKLRYVMLNVSLYSLTMWLIHTFIRIGEQEIILDSILWNIVRRTLFPFSTYFFFQSSFDLFSLYQRCK